MVEVYIGVGSNIGEREGNIARAIRLIDHECSLLRKSRVYETEPVGLREQPWFLNCVVEVDTHLSPKKLLTHLQSIEKRLGRVKTVKGGPRIIDLDILLYGNRVIEDEELIVPHPNLHMRRFVLAPLADLDPDLHHPVLKKTVRQLLEGIKGGEKVKIH